MSTTSTASSVQAQAAHRVGSGLEFRGLKGLGCRVWGLGFMVWGLGFKGLGFRGLGFRGLQRILGGCMGPSLWGFASLVEGMDSWSNPFGSFGF